MRRVILFAFAVCVALTQVHGSELDDEIILAIGKFNIIASSAQRIAQSTRTTFNDVKRKLDLRTQQYIRNQSAFGEEAISSAVDVSVELILEAREANLPQEVLMCITRNGKETILEISRFSSQYRSDMRRLQASKLAAHGPQAEKIRQIQKALPGQYEKGVADLKSCTTVSSLSETLQRLEREYTQTVAELYEIESTMTNNLADFEREAAAMTKNTKNSIILARDSGVKNMRECMPQTA